MLFKKLNQVKILNVALLLIKLKYRTRNMGYDTQ